jgi:hypothetical protein
MNEDRTQPFQPRFLRSLRFLLFVCLLSVFGCGSSNSEMVTVKGVLTYQGKPIPQILIRFEPDDLTKKSTSMAVTDKDGRFEMLIGSTPGVFRGPVKVFCEDPVAAVGSKSKVPADVETAYRQFCAKYGGGKPAIELTIDKPHSNLALKLD